MKARLAIVDDEVVVCRRLSQALSRDGYEVEAFTSGRSFLERMQQQPFDIVFSDLRMADMDGMEVLAATKKIRSETEVIIITGYGSIESAVDAIKEGAHHYVLKPLKLNEIRLLAKGTMEKISMCQENLRLREALKGASGLNAMVGVSPAIKNLFSMIRKIAPVDCNILLQGASGTGKALAAKAIHQLSPRKDHAFVSFNCGGFAEELIASELFGHEKVAVTHFIEKYRLAFRKPVAGIQPQALQILANYPYPGNVRELENIVERAVALTDADRIRPQNLPQDLQQLEFDSIEAEGLLPLSELEKRYIAKVLEQTGYSKALTAQILGIPRTTLWRKLKEYRIG